MTLLYYEVRSFSVFFSNKTKQLATLLSRCFSLRITESLNSIAGINVSGVYEPEKNIQLDADQALLLKTTCCTSLASIPCLHAIKRS